VSPAERATLTAALECVLPGAAEAGAAGYAERLAARSDPSAAAERLSVGLALLDSLAEGMWGAPFAACSGEQRDGVLEELGRVPHHSAQRCLRMLVQLAIRGFLCAPEHGGNRGGAGWKFAGFTPHPRTAGVADALR
jgi:hypothetical protein